MTDEQNLATEVKTGKIFKLARKELGLTKAEVSKATFMNMGYIDAIEKGDYTIFPSEGFAKAYFIKYQNFLSLECDFPPVYEDNNRQDEIIKKSIAKMNPSIIPIIRAVGILSLLITIIIFINSNFLNNKENLDSNTKITLDKDIKKLEEEIILTDLIQDQSNMVIEELPPTQASNQLIFSFFEECWIEIYSSDKLIVNKLFNYGDSFEIEIERPFKIVVGNAEAIEASYNSNSIDFIGNANRLNVSTIIFDNE